MPDLHPLRGNGFKALSRVDPSVAAKVGSMVMRTERFGPDIPSVEGQKAGATTTISLRWQDLEHRASNFATYQGLQMVTELDRYVRPDATEVGH